MKCKHCGHEMPEGARFCAGCGNEMETAPVQPAPQQPQPQPEQNVVQAPQPQVQPVDDSSAGVPIAPPPLGTTDNSASFNSNAQVPPENGSFGYAPPVQQPAPPVQQPVPPYTPLYMPPNQPVYAQNQMPDDRKSVGLNILGFFVPLVGIILWAVNKKDKPIQSKSVIHSAIGGMITALVLSIVGVLIVTLGTFALFGGIASSVPQGDDSIHFEEAVTVDSADNNADDSANKIVGKIDWTSFEVSIGDKSVTFPCSCEEFVNATGFKINEDQLNETLEKNEYTIVRCSNGQGNTVYLKLLNDTQQEKSISDTTLRAVGLDVDASDCSKKVSTCLGISLGDTWSLSTFAEKCGETSYEYDGSNGYATRQWSDNDDVYNDFEITTYEGEVVEEIEVSCFGD